MGQDCNNVQAIPLWPTNVFVSSIDIDTTNLISEIYQLNRVDTNYVKSNYGGWQSNSELHKNNVFQNLISNITKVLQFTFNTPNVTIKQTWACINKKNDLNLIHSHGNQYHISGVFYLQVPENSGNIVFKDPRPGASNSSCQYLFNEGDIENFIPVDKQLIFFPSYLEHYVLPNQSDYDRISISFDAIIG